MYITQNKAQRGEDFQKSIGFRCCKEIVIVIFALNDADIDRKKTDTIS